MESSYWVFVVAIVVIGYVKIYWVFPLRIYLVVNQFWESDAKKGEMSHGRLRCHLYKLYN